MTGVRGGPAAADAVIPEALVLRQFALDVLGGVRPDTGVHAAAGACQANAWQLFLQAECCALPLLSRLRRLDLHRTLPEAARVVLQHAAQRELQRVMAAGSQLRQLDKIAARVGVVPVVLKGGAHLAARGEPLDLGDLDVLLSEREGDALTDAIRASGYQPVDSQQDDVDAHHRPGLALPGGLAVEVHRRLRHDGGAFDDVLGVHSETVPLDGYATLRQGVGPRILTDLLQHSVTCHPYRFGHLRDLVLIAAMMRTVGADGCDAVARSLAADPAAPELHLLLALARGVDAGAPLPDPAGCRLIAARKYALAAGEDLALGRMAGLLSYVGFERSERTRARIVAYVRSRGTTTSRWFLPRVARVSRRAAYATAYLLRTLPRVAVLLSALAVTPRAVARARRRVQGADALMCSVVA